MITYLYLLEHLIVVYTGIISEISLHPNLFFVSFASFPRAHRTLFQSFRGPLLHLNVSVAQP